MMGDDGPDSGCGDDKVLDIGTELWEATHIPHHPGAPGVFLCMLQHPAQGQLWEMPRGSMLSELINELSGANPEVAAVADIL